MNLTDQKNKQRDQYLRSKLSEKFQSIASGKRILPKTRSITNNEISNIRREMNKMHKEEDGLNSLDITIPSAQNFYDSPHQKNNSKFEKCMLKSLNNFR